MNLSKHSFVMVIFLGILFLPGKQLFGTGKSTGDSTTYQSLIQKGQNYLNQNQWFAALDNFKNALQLQKTPEAYTGLAKAEFEMGKLSDDPGDFWQQTQKAWYFREAVSNYQNALQLNPADLASKYELAEVYLYRREPKDLKAAAGLLEQVKSQDPKFRDVLILLGKTYDSQWETDKAVNIFEDYATAEGTNARVYLRRAIYAAQHDSLLAAEQYYMQALDDSDKTSQPILLEDVQMLFSRQDMENYQKTKNKSAFLKTFWLVRDPTPRTPENERVEEHLRRLAYVCKYFRSTESFRKYDDRGTIYLKYGEPSYRYWDTGGGAEDGVQGLNRYQNESWTYDYVLGDNKDGLVFDFANKSKTGYTMVNDLDETIIIHSGGIRGYMPGLGDPLAREQFALATLFPAQILYRNRADVNYGYYGRLAYMSHSASDFAYNLKEFIKKKQEAYLRAPADLFLYKKNPPEKIPLNFERASFRGENGKTRYEIYYGIPMQSLKFIKVKKYQSNAFNQEIIIREIDNKRLYSDLRTIQLEFENNKSLKNEWYTGQINFDLSSQPYPPVAHLTVEDPNNAQMALAYWQLPNRSFYGDSLMVSDTKFSYMITPSREDDPFTHNGFRVVPLTTNRFPKTKPVYVYFEVYNLRTDVRNNAQYKLQCTVQKIANAVTWGYTSVDKNKQPLPQPGQKKPNEYLSLENTFTGMGAQQPNYLTLDMNKLDEGVYDFMLTVIDLHTEHQASTQRNIVLLKK